MSHLGLLGITADPAFGGSGLATDGALYRCGRDVTRGRWCGAQLRGAQ